MSAVRKLETSQPMAAVSDHDLVQRTTGGDMAAFEVIMRRYNQRLYRITRSILKNEQDAMDAMQEAYITAYDKLETISSPTGLSGWLSRVAANAALKLLRERRYVQSVDTGDTAMTDALIDRRTPLRSVMDCELRCWMMHTVDQLPDAFRVVFVMRCVEQMSTSEVAIVLGIPEATVKTRFHRARKALQKQLSSHMDDVQDSIFEFGGHRCDRVVQYVLDRLPTR